MLDIVLLSRQSHGRQDLITVWEVDSGGLKASRVASICATALSFPDTLVLEKHRVAVIQPQRNAPCSVTFT